MGAVKVIAIFQSGSLLYRTVQPESSTIWLSKSSNLTGSPISITNTSPAFAISMVRSTSWATDQRDRHEVARDLGIANRERTAARNLLAK
jgi:hypothetical protein